MPHPKYPDYGETFGGDELTHSPNKTSPSLLGSERDTQFTRRLETDSDRNLYVHVAADDTAAPSSVSALANGAITVVPASTLSTIVTYTAPAAKKLTRISVSGTIYAKYQLFKNTVLIETIRTGPDRSYVFDFDSPLSLATSDVLDVKVTHYFTGHTEDFESTVYGA